MTVPFCNRGPDMSLRTSLNAAVASALLFLLSSCGDGQTNKKVRVDTFASNRLLSSYLNDMSVAKTQEEAYRVLRDGWTLRGHAPVRIQKRIDWNNSRGDRNFHYKLNALMFNEPLIDAFRQTGDERFYRAGLNALLDWGHANVRIPGMPTTDRPVPQPKENKMRWYDMAAARRAIQLAFFIKTERSHKLSDPETWRTLDFLAEKHANVMLRFGRIRSNHGTYSATGLGALASVLKDAKLASRTRREARKWLIQSLNHQFSSEGFHLEDTPGYHINIGRAVQQIRYLGAFSGVQELEELASRTFSRNPLLWHPNGDAVLIGDGNARSIPDLWLSTHGAKGAAPPAGEFVFPKTGLGIYRSDFQTSPWADHSYLYFSASFRGTGHSHTDFGTFEYTAKGLPVIVNSGGFSYERDKWRRFFRSTTSGSTIEVDGKAHPVVGGQKGAQSNYFYGSALQAGGKAGSSQFFSARFDLKKPGIVHERTLIVDDTGWLVVFDRLVDRNGKPHRYRQLFQFHEDLSVTAEDGFVAKHPGGQVVYLREASAAQTQGPFVGETNPISGWVSRKYLEKTPRATVAFSNPQETKPVVFASLLSLDRAPSVFSVEPTEKGHVVGFEFADGAKHRFLIQKDHEVKAIAQHP